MRMNILLTSVGRRGYLVDFFRQALNEQGELHVSNSVFTSAMNHANCSVITPPIMDETYISFLINYCQEFHILAIIPLFDPDIFVLANNKAKFEEIGVKLIVPDKRVVGICIDKLMTSLFVDSIGMKYPRSFTDLLSAKEAILNGDIAFPLVLKPRLGYGSFGLYEVINEEELEVLYKKLFREICSSQILSFLSKQCKDPIIIQEKICGQEIGIEIINDLEGHYVSSFVKNKFSMRAGETDAAMIVDAETYEFECRNIGTHLRHVAVLDVDAFVTDNQDLFIIDMNCRFGGQYPFSHLAGANVPQQIVRWLLGQSTQLDLLRPKVGTMSCKEISPQLV